MFVSLMRLCLIQVRPPATRPTSQPPPPSPSHPSFSNCKPKYRAAAAMTTPPDPTPPPPTRYPSKYSRATISSAVSLRRTSEPFGGCIRFLAPPVTTWSQYIVINMHFYPVRSGLICIQTRGCRITAGIKWRRRRASGSRGGLYSRGCGRRPSGSEPVGSRPSG